MNVVFVILVLSSAIVFVVQSPEELLPTMIEGTSRAVQFAVSLFCIYVVWLTVLEILKRTSIAKKLSRMLASPIKRLFPRENDAAYNHLALNLSANLLGMGGAATPAGIAAMESMQSKKNRIMLVVVNATSIQLIPTTILGMRAEYGGVTDIILPSLVTTMATTIIAVILVKVFVRDK